MRRMFIHSNHLNLLHLWPGSLLFSAPALDCKVVVIYLKVCSCSHFKPLSSRGLRLTLFEALALRRASWDGTLSAQIELPSELSVPQFRLSLHISLRLNSIEFRFNSFSGILGKARTQPKLFSSSLIARDCLSFQWIYSQMDHNPSRCDNRMKRWAGSGEIIIILVVRIKLLWDKCELNKNAETCPRI